MLYQISVPNKTYQIAFRLVILLRPASTLRYPSACCVAAYFKLCKCYMLALFCWAEEPVRSVHL